MVLASFHSPKLYLSISFLSSENSRYDNHFIFLTLLVYCLSDLHYYSCCPSCVLYTDSALNLTSDHYLNYGLQFSCWLIFCLSFLGWPHLAWCSETGLYQVGAEWTCHGHTFQTSWTPQLFYYDFIWILFFACSSQQSTLE
jgi:hypothetical protein